jgi:hypothetical protein
VADITVPKTLFEHKIRLAGSLSALWPCVFAAMASLLVASRWPDVILHANFWGEDGWVWYAKAREPGLVSLIQPHTGYLQTVPRLVALAAQPFPLAWAPTIFAAAAVAIQVGAATYLVSDRMSAAWPSTAGRILFALVYLLLPNSAEVYANLTNAQFHLAFFAFLVLASTPPAGWAGAGLDAFILVLSGLSGPFCIFLAPVAVLRAWRDRDSTRYWRAAVVLASCVVQIGVLSLSYRRPGSMLGAGPRRLAVIVAFRVVLAALVGRHTTIKLGDLPIWQSNLLPLAVTFVASALTILACLRGSDLVRWGCLAGGLLFAAALISPAPMTRGAWVIISDDPDWGSRYFVLPMLAWIGVLFTLAADRTLVVRVVGVCLIALLLVELPGDWHLSPLDTWRPRTDFVARARAFAHAPVGTRIEFPTNPPWAPPMALVKTN